jgi:hypothetical protein
VTTALLHVAFVFAVLGSKLLIAVWAIYHLFPNGSGCPECSGDTLAMRMGPARRAGSLLLFLGRVGVRWCPECGWEGYARPLRAVRRPIRFPAPDPADQPS